MSRQALGDDVGKPDAPAGRDFVGQRADDHRAVGALAGVELAATAVDARRLFERAQERAQEDGEALLVVSGTHSPKKRN